MTAFHEIKLYNFENYVVNIKCNGYYGIGNLEINSRMPVYFTCNSKTFYYQLQNNIPCIFSNNKLTRYDHLAGKDNLVLFLTYQLDAIIFELHPTIFNKRKLLEIEFKSEY